MESSYHCTLENTKLNVISYNNERTDCVLFQLKCETAQCTAMPNIQKLQPNG